MAPKAPKGESEGNKKRGGRGTAQQGNALGPKPQISKRKRGKRRPGCPLVSQWGAVPGEGERREGGGLVVIKDEPWDDKGGKGGEGGHCCGRRGLRPSQGRRGEGAQQGRAVRGGRGKRGEGRGREG